MQKLCVFVGIRRRDHVENMRLEILTHKDGYDDLRGLPGRRVFSIFRFRFFIFFKKLSGAFCSDVFLSFLGSFKPGSRGKSCVSSC